MISLLESDLESAYTGRGVGSLGDKVGSQHTCNASVAIRCFSGRLALLGYLQCGMHTDCTLIKMASFSHGG